LKITIYGSGYVGLVTGVCFAEVGNEVVCVDVDADKVARLAKGDPVIYEPGLEAMLKRNIDEGRIRFTTDAAVGVAHGSLQYIAVGTPPDEDGSADLKYVLTVAKSIATHMDDYRLVITKSTVPVGTAEKVRGAMAATLETRGAAIEFDVASNPEFLKEGDAIGDFMKPDRVVVGCDSERAAELLRELYAPFNRSSDRMFVMDIPSAELTKYAANAMLATKISFMNELAGVAEAVGADIESVRRGIGSDQRIGYHFIYPGCGYGGSCFPKDVKALVRTAAAAGKPPKILQAVEAVNELQKHWPAGKLKDHFGDLSGKTIALWGLSFKPKTDDMREATSRVFMETVWAAGAKVQAYDPVAMDECRRIYGERDDLQLVDDRYAALNNADVLVIVTEWQEFRSPDFDWIAKQLNNPVIIDGRNLYDPVTVASHGIDYMAVGRPRVTPV